MTLQILNQKKQMLIKKIKENPYANYEELVHNTDLSNCIYVI